MARRFYIKSSSRSKLHAFPRGGIWKLFLLVPILILIAIPTFFAMTERGMGVMPALTEFFYQLSSPAAPSTPTPLPPFPQVLPQPGSLEYVVQDGDNCVSILAYELNMNNAGQVFSDTKPETVKALNESMGQDCHRLQPGMTLKITPHYPLVALGGVVQKIEAQTTEEVVPTPLIDIPKSPNEQQKPSGTNCSNGCKLTVRVNPQTEVYVMVESAVPVKVGSWVWVQAMMERKFVKNFKDYPYADANASFDKKTLRACDFQVDDKHDDNSLPCYALMPNTIRDDGGVWLFGVTGSGSLDHWGYRVQQPPNTRVLIWLSYKDGNLVYKEGDPRYRYNDKTQLYEKI